MGWGTRFGAVILSGALATSGPTMAQDAADDWDFGSDPARKLTIAAVTFDSFGVAVRCMDGNLGVVMSGLPVATGERRLAYQMGDQDQPQSLWVSGRNSTAAFALWPRYVATGLSRGGRLTVAALDGERLRQYTVDLPASQAAIGRVFEACGHALPAPGEDSGPSGETFSGVKWVTQPRANFPSGTEADGSLAALTCTLRADGGFRDCVIESEFPEGGGFGRAATFAAHRRGRAEPIVPGQNMEGIKVTYLTRFNISQSPPLPTTPSRLPPREITGTD